MESQCEGGNTWLTYLTEYEHEPCTAQESVEQDCREEHLRMFAHAIESDGPTTYEVGVVSTWRWGFGEWGWTEFLHVYRGGDMVASMAQCCAYRTGVGAIIELECDYITGYTSQWIAPYPDDWFMPIDEVGLVGLPHGDILRTLAGTPVDEIDHDFVMYAIVTGHRRHWEQGPRVQERSDPGEPAKPIPPVGPIELRM